MSYTLGQAARAAGKSKPTIARAIKSGRLSAAREADGSYLIDPAELHRVYPVTGNGDGTMKQSVTGAATGTVPVTSSGDVETLRAWLADRDETIRDLRARLDAEAEERRREAEERRRLQALLVDRRSWWRRWFR